MGAATQGKPALRSNSPGPLLPDLLDISCQSSYGTQGDNTAQQSNTQTTQYLSVKIQYLIFNSISNFLFLFYRVNMVTLLKNKTFEKGSYVIAFILFDPMSTHSYNSKWLAW